MNTINSSQGAMTNLPCRPDNVANRITVHSTFLAVAVVYASIATPIVSLYHCSLSHEANTANRDGVLQSDRVRMSTIHTDTSQCDSYMNCGVLVIDSKCFCVYRSVMD